MGPLRRSVGAIGEAIIRGLIRGFGRVVREGDVPWLLGPIGGPYIGDRPYAACAEREGLDLVRDATEGGLVPDFEALRGPSFDPSAVEPAVRRFYEQTANHRMDMWAESPFPANIGLWLLVATISRRVNQLNFPVGALETAHGMSSEIVLLREPSGAIRYTGWFRKLVGSGRVVYTGFYMTQRVPEHDSPCVKVVFPMPGGNATVVLRPAISPAGRFQLISAGSSFGDVGFYRVLGLGGGRLRVWRVRSLTERFEVYCDDEGVLRCDHVVRFLGLTALRLHYRIEERGD